MKSRRILAAVLAPVCAVSATAAVAFAEENSVVLVDEAVELADNWSKGAMSYGDPAVAAIKAGDKVVIALSDLKEGATICVVQGDGWKRLPGLAKAEGAVENEGEWNIPLADDATSYTYTITEEDAAILTKDGGIVVSGTKATVDSVTLVIAAEDETPADAENSDETPADGDSEPAAPGETDKAPVVIEADIKGVDSKNGVEGDALNALLLVQDGVKYTWEDVESITFTSDKLFSVQFSANKDIAGTEWFTMGKDVVPAAKADEASEWANEWTLTDAEIALFDTTKADKGYVKVIGKEDGTDINVKVNIKADAKGTPVEDGKDDGKDNQDTGIALAIAPVVLAGAAAAVVAISKKRK